MKYLILISAAASLTCIGCASKEPAYTYSSTTSYKGTAGSTAAAGELRQELEPVAARRRRPSASWGANRQPYSIGN